MAKYRHYVFCAANIAENMHAIDNACRAARDLDHYWSINASCTGVYEGPKFSVNPNDGGNTEILAESDSLITLIEGCMAFAREVERLRQRVGY